MDLGLSGRVAVVTGASRGLGRAIVAGFAQEGMRVVATARSKADLDALAGAHPDAVIAVAADRADAEAPARVVGEAIDAFDRLDVVVNNAGIAPAARFADEPMSAWIDVFNVNV